MTHLSILYRGPLSSCNYTCDYCPFGKTKNTRAELLHDRRCLERFVEWVAGHRQGIGVLFTPWGEGLIRRHYREALVRLSHLPNVSRCAIQTNLSCGVEWTVRANPAALALWATWHPTQTPRGSFVARCDRLLELGVRFSVGVVGLPCAVAEIEALRRELPPAVYLWINAVKRELGSLTDDVRRRFVAVDPLFELNTRAYASAGRACRAGHTVISVLGDGTARRCHFIAEPIGNIYDAGFEAALAPSPCTAAECRCHIGYVHMNDLGLYDVFGDGVLERIPRGWPLDVPRTRVEASAHASC